MMVRDRRTRRARGVTLVRRTRCGQCGKYARLLPGDVECAACAGMLALIFDTISVPSQATARGAW